MVSSCSLHACNGKENGLPLLRGSLHACEGRENGLGLLRGSLHASFVPRPLWHIPKEGRGSGIHCLCMRETTPGFYGVRISPYLTVDYICELFVNVHFIAWV